MERTPHEADALLHNSRDYLNWPCGLAGLGRSLATNVDVTVFDQPFASPEAAPKRVEDFEIILRDARAHAVPARLFAGFAKLSS